MNAKHNWSCPITFLKDLQEEAQRSTQSQPKKPQAKLMNSAKKFLESSRLKTFTKYEHCLSQ